MTGSAAWTSRVLHRIDDELLEKLGPLTPEGSLYDSGDWLRYCELSAEGSLRYVLLENSENDPVGFAVVRIVPDGNVMSLYDLSALAQGGDADANLKLFPNAVSAVSGAHCVFLTDTSVDPGVAAALRGELAREVVRVAEGEGCRAVGFLYLDQTVALDISDALGPEAGRPFLVDAHMELTGGWSDFEEYLATLRRSRRTPIRKERNRFAAAGLRTRVVCGTSELGEATARLQLALRERYGAPGSIASIMRDYERLRTTVEDRIRVFLCEQDDQTVGMSLALVDGERMYVRLAGFDYEAAAAEEFTYFNAVYYEPIEWGIGQGITRYSFGTATYEAKIARGCVPAPVYAVVLWPESMRAKAWAQLAVNEAHLRARVGLAPAETIANDELAVSI